MKHGTQGKKINFDTFKLADEAENIWEKGAEKCLFSVRNGLEKLFLSLQNGFGQWIVIFRNTIIILLFLFAYLLFLKAIRETDKPFLKTVMIQKW